MINSSNTSVIATVPFMFSATMKREANVERLIDFATGHNERQYE